MMFVLYKMYEYCYRATGIYKSWYFFIGLGYEDCLISAKTKTISYFASWLNICKILFQTFQLAV